MYRFTTQEQLRDHIESQGYHVARVYTLDSSKLAEWTAETPAKLADLLIGFVDRFPGRFVVVTKTKDRSPESNVHKFEWVPESNAAMQGVGVNDVEGEAKRLFEAWKEKEELRREIEDLRRDINERADSMQGIREMLTPLLHEVAGALLGGSGVGGQNFGDPSAQGTTVNGPEADEVRLLAVAKELSKYAEIDFLEYLALFIAENPGSIEQIKNATGYEKGNGN